MTDEEFEALRTSLRPRITDEFLATLVEAAKIDGWSNDFIETNRFVASVFEIAGKEMPDRLCPNSASYTKT